MHQLFTIAAALSLAGWGLFAFASPNNSPMTQSDTPASTVTPGSSHAQLDVPQAILDRVVSEAAKLAQLSPAQVMLIRAEAVVWNDGSLGCPEPGIEYAQALVNGYWVVTKAAGKMYDFRAGRDGNLRLCPDGSGRPPLPSNAQ